MLFLFFLQHINGGTAFHDAMDFSNDSMIETFLRIAAVDLRICDKRGLNPFHTAVQKKYTL